MFVGGTALFVFLGGVNIYASVDEVGPTGRLPKYTQTFSRLFFGDSSHSINDVLSQPNNDNNNMFSLNGYVGIGTTSPLQKLDVRGNIVTNGSVEIGKSESPQKLDVHGKIVASDDVCTDEGKCLSSITSIKNPLLTILRDDCAVGGGLNCPIGMHLAGWFHVGESQCDGLPRGVANDGNTIESGWMGLCVPN